MLPGSTERVRPPRAAKCHQPSADSKLFNCRTEAAPPPRPRHFDVGQSDRYAPPPDARDECSTSTGSLGSSQPTSLIESRVSSCPKPCSASPVPQLRDGRKQYWLCSPTLRLPYSPPPPRRTRVLARPDGYHGRAPAFAHGLISRSSESAHISRKLARGARCQLWYLLSLRLSRPALPELVRKKLIPHNR